MSKLVKQAVFLSAIMAAFPVAAGDLITDGSPKTHRFARSVPFPRTKHNQTKEGRHGLTGKQVRKLGKKRRKHNG